MCKKNPNGDKKMYKNNNSIIIDGEKYNEEKVRFLIEENRSLHKEIKSMRNDLSVLMEGL